jgi:uncharacterized phage-associated protein
MVPVQEVALLLVRLAAADPDGESMTPLRLQKLLYYCQGWHLAWYGKPLFSDRLEAWREGPVVPVVYNYPWAKGRGPITVEDLQSEAEYLSLMDQDQKRAIEQVWSHYRQFSAIGLKDKSHNEEPWKKHWHPDANNRGHETIPREDLVAFFGAEYYKQTGDAPGSANSYKTTNKKYSLEEIRREFGC